MHPTRGIGCGDCAPILPGVFVLSARIVTKKAKFFNKFPSDNTSVIQHLTKKINQLVLNFFLDCCMVGKRKAKEAVTCQELGFW